MQKPLNTYPSALFWLAQRLPQLLFKNKAGLVALMTLLWLAQDIESAKAANFTSDLVFITGNVKGNPIKRQRYYTNSPGTSGISPDSIYSASKPLGTFDRSLGAIDALFINAEVNTHANAGETVSATQLYYRIYRSDATDSASFGNFIPLPLNYVSGMTMGDAKWNNFSNRQNLIEFARSPGSYTLQIYFQANVGNAGASFLDNNNGLLYVTTFEVTVNGSSVQASTWNASKQSSNWFDPANWDNGVPNTNTDVTIAYQRGGIYPIINNNNPAAQVHNLRLTGRNPPIVLLNLAGSTLYVYGNIDDTQASFKQTSGLLALAGAQAQSFDGASLTDVLVTGGGTKNLTGLITIKNRLIFQINSNGTPGGNLVTGTGNPSRFGVLLDGGQLVGESENGYVQGTVINNSQAVVNGQDATFGNIGVTLNANSGALGSATLGTVTIVRTSSVYAGSGTSVSISRSFTFSGPTTPHDFNLVFSYLNADLNGVTPSNLRLFRSETGDIPFEGLDKTSNDATAKTLTKSGITGSLNALFTLGDVANPLPVTITNFTAVAQGADAVLNWATASETNNQGFEVQVSTDGTVFSKLGFLAANTPNSSTPHSYQYRDATAGKQGTRYYRLRQLDLDGTESFVGPQAVTFGGAVAQTSLQGYPSPFSSEINLAMQNTAAGLATVTVTDGVGRQVRAWQPTLAAGTSSLRLAELQNMPAGLYIVQVRYNDGQTQQLKMVKE